MGPLGTFNYYLDNAIGILNMPRVRVKELRETNVRGFKCMLVLFSQTGNPNGIGAQIFYETEEQKKLILKNFL